MPLDQGPVLGIGDQQLALGVGEVAGQLVAPVRGLPPTMTAPARAAAPIQKTYSGTLSSSSATWKGPGSAERRQHGGPLGLGHHDLAMGPGAVGEGEAQTVVAGPQPDELVDGLHRFPLGRAGRSGWRPAVAADSRCKSARPGTGSGTNLEHVAIYQTAVLP